MKPVATDESLATALSRWRTTVEAELKGAPFDKKLVTRTFEGAALQPLYTRQNVAAVPHLAQAPGAAPYLRGNKINASAVRSWEIAQEISAPTPADFNRLVLAALLQGQDSVTLTPDAATLAEMDPDQAPAGSVGSAGTSLADAADLGRALEGVDLSCVPVHLATGAVARPLGALFFAAMTARGLPLTSLSGSITADPLDYWVRCGSARTPLSIQFDELAAWTRWVENNAPALRTIGVSSTAWSDAGATATQELAFALAAGVDYLRAMATRDLPVARAAARMRFTFAVGSQFFTEIAKFRAFRLVWSRALAAFDAAAAAKAVVVHAETGTWNKTVHDVHVNLLRLTTEACSAVLGGIDSLAIAPYDAVIGEGDETSRRIARNLHTVLAEEFHLADTADAAGGSWYVESLTDDLARRAWKLFQEIEEHGGYVAALRRGFVQQLVQDSAAEKADALDRRRVGLVGTTLFPNLRETRRPPAARDLAAIAAARSDEITARRDTAAASEPGIEAAIRAAAAGATIGQLSHTHAPAKGEQDMRHDAITAVRPRRAAEGFEELRRRADAIARRTGARPKVFLAKIGPVKQHKPRADFSAGFFSVGGFELAGKEAFDNATAAAQAAATSGAPVVVLCSTDETYPELVPVFGVALKAARPGVRFILAGLPAEAAVVAAYRAAGVDEFIHVRANARTVLAQLLQSIESLA